MSPLSLRKSCGPGFNYSSGSIPKLLLLLSVEILDDTAVNPLPNTSLLHILGTHGPIQPPEILANLQPRLAAARRA